MPQWKFKFSIEADDIDYLTNLLLEREMPLSSAALGRALIERRRQQAVEQFQERFRGTRLYNPAHSYEPGQRIVFPRFDFAIGVVDDVRAGVNEAHGTFQVIAVEFEDNGGKTREFAADLTTPHKLSQTDEEEAVFAGDDADFDPDEILADQYDEIVAAVNEALAQQSDLVLLANKWFPRDLILEVNEGHLNLAEAVLDLASGGPMDAQMILEEIGGLGKSDQELQIFSLNYALNADRRFDEVGPSGKVLWFLQRLEPEAVLKTPDVLRYAPLSFDGDLISDEMLDLEAEIADEHSIIMLNNDDPADEVTLTLIYPHRRAGTLPLNAHLEQIFPTARRTERIWVTLVDGQDGETFNGWVVRKDKYVYGLTELYQKHKLPVGAYVRVRRAAEPGKIVVDFAAHRPRTEYIRLIVPKNGQMAFENQKRAIGADYDELMILGADDVAAVDELFQAMRQNRRGIGSILRGIIAELGRLTPQGTVHAKTIYSAVNVIYRCPPAPIFAALVNDPDFETVGNHYWKLASST